jgi:hypothetical protein
MGCNNITDRNIVNKLLLMPGDFSAKSRSSHNNNLIPRYL